MKQARSPQGCARLRMPPTRGHDLKHTRKLYCRTQLQMPPTRGHDLKQGQ